MAHFCAAATGLPGRLAWCIIPPPLTFLNMPVKRRTGNGWAVETQPPFDYVNTAAQPFFARL